MSSNIYDCVWNPGSFRFCIFYLRQRGSNAYTLTGARPSGYVWL
jgi:hypothetical protein